MPILLIFIVALCILFALTLGPPLDLSRGWRYAPENWWRDVSARVFPEPSVASESLPPILPLLPPEEKVVTSPVLDFIEVTSVRKSTYAWEAAAVVEPEGVIAPSPPPERTALISFAFDSADLSFDARQSLDWAVELMQQSEGSSAIIAGYSDSKGNAIYNRQLSQKRATVVADYLINAGVQKYRLEVEGRGIYDGPDGGATMAATELAKRARIVQIVIRDVGL